MRKIFATVLVGLLAVAGIFAAAPAQASVITVGTNTYVGSYYGGYYNEFQISTWNYKDTATGSVLTDEWRVTKTAGQCGITGVDIIHSRYGYPSPDLYTFSPQVGTTGVHSFTSAWNDWWPSYTLSFTIHTVCGPSWAASVNLD